MSRGERVGLAVLVAFSALYSTGLIFIGMWDALAGYWTTVVVCGTAGYLFGRHG